MVKKVLSLGQCGADHSSIGGLLHRQFGADVVAARTSEDALAKLRQGGFALVLVNRVLDYDGGSGLDFIDMVRGDAGLAGVPVMLVSNYPDAQQEAVARGALPGFGKSALREPQTLSRLAEVLA
ncbi:MAG TPA: response regulator [Gemmataceae bacterium]|nr:response regulator [Gemmataceae bacterium]